MQIKPRSQQTSTNPNCHAFYYWCENKQFSTMQHSWIDLGSSVFGRSRPEDVTREDLKRFFANVKAHRYYTVRLRYLGTAEVPFPPLGWGHVNFFECVSMTPHGAGS